MLRLQRNQMELLETAQQDAFKARVANRLRQHFEKCRLLEDEELRSLVSRGILQAGEKGFSSAQHISRYLGLMVALGEEFARDGRHPWACEILEEKGLSLSQKMDRLYECALREET